MCRSELPRPGQVRLGKKALSTTWIASSAQQENVSQRKSFASLKGLYNEMEVENEATVVPELDDREHSFFWYNSYEKTLKGLLKLARNVGRCHEVASQDVDYILKYCINSERSTKIKRLGLRVISYLVEYHGRYCRLKPEAIKSIKKMMKHELSVLKNSCSDGKDIDLKTLNIVILTLCHCIKNHLIYCDKALHDDISWAIEQLRERLTLFLPTVTLALSVTADLDETPPPLCWDVLKECLITVDSDQYEKYVKDPSIGLKEIPEKTYKEAKGRYNSWRPYSSLRDLRNFSETGERLSKTELEFVLDLADSGWGKGSAWLYGWCYDGALNKALKAIRFSLKNGQRELPKPAIARKLLLDNLQSDSRKLKYEAILITKYLIRYRRSNNVNIDEEIHCSNVNIDEEILSVFFEAISSMQITALNAIQQLYFKEKVPDAQTVIFEKILQELYKNNYVTPAVKTKCGYVLDFVNGSFDKRINLLLISSETEEAIQFFLDLAKKDQDISLAVPNLCQIVIKEDYSTSAKLLAVEALSYVDNYIEFPLTLIAYLIQTVCEIESPQYIGYKNNCLLILANIIGEGLSNEILKEISNIILVHFGIKGCEKNTCKIFDKLINLNPKVLHDFSDILLSLVEKFFIYLKASVHDSTLMGELLIIIYGLNEKIKYEFNSEQISHLISVIQEVDDIEIKHEVVRLLVESNKVKKIVLSKKAIYELSKFLVAEDCPVELKKDILTLFKCQIDNSRQIFDETVVIGLKACLKESELINATINLLALHAEHDGRVPKVFISDIFLIVEENLPVSDISLSFIIKNLAKNHSLSTEEFNKILMLINSSSLNSSKNYVDALEFCYKTLIQEKKLETMDAELHYRRLIQLACSNVDGYIISKVSDMLISLSDNQICFEEDCIRELLFHFPSCEDQLQFQWLTLLNKQISIHQLAMEACPEDYTNIVSSIQKTFLVCYENLSVDKIKQFLDILLILNQCMQSVYGDKICNALVDILIKTHDEFIKRGILHVFENTNFHSERLDDFIRLEKCANKILEEPIGLWSLIKGFLDSNPFLEIKSILKQKKQITHNCFLSLDSLLLKLVRIQDVLEVYLLVLENGHTLPVESQKVVVSFIDSADESQLGKHFNHLISIISEYVTSGGELTQDIWKKLELVFITKKQNITLSFLVLLEDALCKDFDIDKEIIAYLARLSGNVDRQCGTVLLRIFDKLDKKNSVSISRKAVEKLEKKTQISKLSYALEKFDCNFKSVVRKAVCDLYQSSKENTDHFIVKEYYESKMNQHVDLLLVKGWPKKFIYDVIKLFNKSTKNALDELLLVFELLVTYSYTEKRLTYDFLAQTFSLNSPSTLVKKVHQACVKACFKQVNGEYEKEQLLEALAGDEQKFSRQQIADCLMSVDDISLNNSFSLLLSDDLSKTAFDKKINSHSISQDKILNWSLDDIGHWATLVKQNPKLLQQAVFIPEALAVISRAFSLLAPQFGYHLRHAQLISIYLLFTKPEESGRFLQVATGEGKTAIIAALSVLKALVGHKVDIITSSPLLADRDAKDLCEFYSVFNLTARSNHEDHYTSGTKACYSNNVDIVYGDISDFQYDYLRHVYSRLNTRGKRPYDTVIADEVDNLVIDRNSTIAMLADPMPGMDQLTPIFLFIWQQLLLLDVTFKEEGSDITFEKLKPVLESSLESFLNGKLDQSEDELSETLLDKVNIELPYRVPKHLKTYVEAQKSKWIHSAFLALYHFDDQQRFSIDQEGEKKSINPVDFANTGVIQKGTSWNNGLDQFLSIKYGLKTNAEQVTTNYVSNVAYFKLYDQANRHGITGTLGSSEAKNLFENIYTVDTISVPTHKEKQLLVLPGEIVDDNDAWLERIAESAWKEVRCKRPVLIVCEFIKDASAIKEKITQYLAKKAFTDWRVTEYTRSDKTGGNCDELILQSGDIVVATNLAGRGTDLKLSKQARLNGGLHVCVTYLPESQRTEEQAFGRAARKGEPGTAQLLLEKNTTLNKLASVLDEAEVEEPLDIIKVKTKRKQLEEKRLADIKQKERRDIDAKDRLFIRYLELIDPEKGELSKIDHEECSADSRKKIACKRQAVEERWGLWLKENEDRSFALADFSTEDLKTLQILTKNQWKSGRDDEEALLAKIQQLELTNEKFKRKCFTTKEIKQLKILLDENDHAALSKTIVEEVNDIEKAFDGFVEDLLQDYRNDTIIKNPIYYIELGHYYLSYAKSTLIKWCGKKSHNAEQAIDAYTKAILLDKESNDYLPYYYRALAYLLQKDVDNKEQAKADLQMVIHLIEDVALGLSSSYLKFMKLFKHDEFNERLEQQLDTQQKVHLLFLQSAKKALKCIKESQRLVNIKVSGTEEERSRLNKEQAFDAIAELASTNQSEDNATHFDLCFHNLKNYLDIWKNYEAFALFDLLKKKHKINIAFDTNYFIEGENRQEALLALLPINNWKEEKSPQKDNDNAVKLPKESLPEIEKSFEKNTQQQSEREKLAAERAHNLSTPIYNACREAKTWMSQAATNVCNSVGSATKGIRESEAVKAVGDKFSKGRKVINGVASETCNRMKAWLGQKKAVCAVPVTITLGISSHETAENFVNICCEQFSEEKEESQPEFTLLVKNIDLKLINSIKSKFDCSKHQVEQIIHLQEGDETLYYFSLHVCKLKEINKILAFIKASQCDGVSESQLPLLAYEFKAENISQNAAEKIIKSTSDKDSVKLQFESLNQDSAKLVVKNIGEFHEFAETSILDVDAKLAEDLVRQAHAKEQGFEFYHHSLAKQIAEKGISQDDLSELQLNGYDALFDLKDKNPFPWKGFAFLCGMGALQILGGVFLTGLTMGVASQIGIALMAEGVSEFINAISVVYYREFSISQWAAQKAISVTISMALLGFNAIKDAVRAARAAATGISIEINAIKATFSEGMTKAAGHLTGIVTKSAVTSGGSALINASFDQFQQCVVNPKILASTRGSIKAIIFDNASIRQKLNMLYARESVMNRLLSSKQIKNYQFEDEFLAEAEKTTKSMTTVDYSKLTHHLDEHLQVKTKALMSLEVFLHEYLTLSNECFLVINEGFIEQLKQLRWVTETHQINLSFLEQFYKGTNKQLCRDSDPARFNVDNYVIESIPFIERIKPVEQLWQTTTFKRALLSACLAYEQIKQFPKTSFKSKKERLVNIIAEKTAINMQSITGAGLSATNGVANALLVYGGEKAGEATNKRISSSVENKSRPRKPDISKGAGANTNDLSDELLDTKPPASTASSASIIDDLADTQPLSSATTAANELLDDASSVSQSRTSVTTAENVILPNSRSVLNTPGTQHSSAKIMQQINLACYFTLPAIKNTANSLILAEILRDYERDLAQLKIDWSKRQQKMFGQLSMERNFLMTLIRVHAKHMLLSAQALSGEGSGQQAIDVETLLKALNAAEEAQIEIILKSYVGDFLKQSICQHFIKIYYSYRRLTQQLQEKIMPKDVKQVNCDSGNERQLVKAPSGGGLSMHEAGFKFGSETALAAFQGAASMFIQYKKTQGEVIVAKEKTRQVELESKVAETKFIEETRRFVAQLPASETAVALSLIHALERAGSFSLDAITTILKPYLDAAVGLQGVGPVALVPLQEAEAPPEQEAAPIFNVVTIDAISSLLISRYGKCQSRKKPIFTICHEQSGSIKQVEIKLSENLIGKDEERVGNDGKFKAKVTKIHELIESSEKNLNYELIECTYDESESELSIQYKSKKEDFNLAKSMFNLFNKNSVAQDQEFRDNLVVTCAVM